jgi:hypothetical protein
MTSYYYGEEEDDWEEDEMLDELVLTVKEELSTSRFHAKMKIDEFLEDNFRVLNNDEENHTDKSNFNWVNNDLVYMEKEGLLNDHFYVA